MLIIISLPIYFWVKKHHSETLTASTFICECLCFTTMLWPSLGGNASSDWGVRLLSRAIEQSLWDYANRDLGSPRFVFNATQISGNDADHHLFSYFRASLLEPKFFKGVWSLCVQRPTRDFWSVQQLLWMMKTSPRCTAAWWLTTKALLIMRASDFVNFGEREPGQVRHASCFSSQYSTVSNWAVLCPELEKFWCAEPDQARLRDASGYFTHATVIALL